MTYVTRDGRVLANQPWGVAKVMSMFWAFIDLIVAYFQTLISPWTEGSSGKSSNNFRQGGSSRGGGGGGGGGGGFFGGGGGGGGGPRGPPKPPSRRNIHGMGDIRPPPGAPPACGSCCG